MLEHDDELSHVDTVGESKDASADREAPESCQKNIAHQN